MRSRFTRVLLCLAVLAPVLPRSARAVDAASTDPTSPVFSGIVTIGATFPLTGSLETYGQSAFYGANARVRLINEAGGVNGKRLVLEWRDNKSDPAQAVRDVEELVREHRVPAILGPLLSESIFRVLDVAEKLKVVVMSPMAAMDVIARDDPWVFTACFNNSAQAEALMRFQMEKYGAKTCAILYDPRYSFTVELADIFERKFPEHGGKVLAKLPFAEKDGVNDYRAPLLALAEKKPDFILATSYALEATEIIRAAREAGVSIRFCGPHTWDNELVFDGSGTRLAGSSFASVLFEQGYDYRPFRTFFAAMEAAGMDNPDAQAACAYDAVSLIAEALLAGETAEQVRDGLLGIKRMALATGRTSMADNGNAVKPVLIRVVKRARERMLPVYAERYDP